MVTAGAVVPVAAVTPVVSGVPSVAAGTGEPAVPWNIAAMGAPTSWAEGRTGTGAVIGFIDSGVDVHHPALETAWRPTSGWYDATGECPAGPCDPVGHGTHAAGTAVGSGGDDGPAIGVAPGASFLAAKACGSDGCLENDLLDAAQWMLAPDGQPGDRPVILVNSWTIASSDTSLDRMPEVWRAAGLVPVFAAGNEGPGCGTIGAPAGQPDALAVGALRQDGWIYPASARGALGATSAKPEVWAPGVDIDSSLPGGGYGLGSGTSMAAPHIAGALALRLGDSKDSDLAVHELTSAPLPAGASCGP
jgi:subtilisin family serine protease